MEKLVRVVNNNFDVVNEYLKEGFYVKKISACTGGSVSIDTFCYVVLSDDESNR